MEKQPTLYASFPLGKHQFKIKEVTRDNSDNYVRTFFISLSFFLERLMVNIEDITCYLLHCSGLLLLHMNIDKLRINI